ncbi:MAG: ATP-binding protein [Candidatus Accumulibacter meliphilus]
MIYSAKTRVETRIERARATGAAAATAPITLVQETGRQTSFLLIVPIYRNAASIATTEEGQDAFLGVVYAAFRMEDLARGVFGDDPQRFDLSVDDVGLVGTRRWRCCRRAAPAAPDGRREQVPARLTVSERGCSTSPVDSGACASMPATRRRVVKRTATVVLAGGTLISMLMFALLQSFAGSRARALELADGMTHELRESEARTRAVLDNTLDAIITIDEQGLIESFNLAAERLFRYTTTEVLGRNVKMLMPAPYADAHDGYLRAYRQTRVRKIIGIDREVLGQRADGSCFAMELAVTEVIVNDRRRFIGLARDITERKKMEQLKTEFVSTVSHELRTPLTSIRGSLGLLEGGIGGQLPAPAKALIGIAANNCDRLVDLINDILDIERIASGRMNFQFATQPLLPLIEQALEANQGFAVQHEVRLELVARPAQGRARIDADRFLQVLANLLSNAAKFSPPGEAVEVSLLRRGDRLRIEVADHGPGIPEEFRARIFEKFSQADGSTTRARGGSGLGLSISKALVERMGGAIGFSSEPGQGARFWCELPEVMAESASMIVPLASADAPRVLVCADDADVAQLLATVLKRAGYEVDLAASAAQAREYLGSRQYAAMTLDMGLPDETGSRPAEQPACRQGRFRGAGSGYLGIARSGDASARWRPGGGRLARQAGRCTATHRRAEAGDSRAGVAVRAHPACRGRRRSGAHRCRPVRQPGRNHCGAYAVHSQGRAGDADFRCGHSRPWLAGRLGAGTSASDPGTGASATGGRLFCQRHRDPSRCAAGSRCQPRQVAYLQRAAVADCP